MDAVTAVMDQMSGKGPVRTGTVLQVGGNVWTIRSASLSICCAMQVPVALMGQMSGLTCANPALKTSGNVWTT